MGAVTDPTEYGAEGFEECCGCAIGSNACQCLCCCGRVKVGGIRW